MVRKQGGLIHQNFAANENVVDRCLAQIKKVEPSSRADKLYHITMKTAAYTEFLMDGFEYKKVKKVVETYQGRFEKMILAKPLLAEEKDYQAVAKAVMEAT